MSKSGQEKCVKGGGFFPHLGSWFLGSRDPRNLFQLDRPASRRGALQRLAELTASLGAGCLDQKSGNMRSRLLPSGGPSKRACAVSASWSEGASSGVHGGMVADRGREAPPTKTVPPQKHPFAGNPPCQNLSLFH